VELGNLILLTQLLLHNNKLSGEKGILAIVVKFALLSNV
jgi:hypothetical protein